MTEREKALEEVLRWLDRRGGLGFDAHDRITAALALAPSKDPLQAVIEGADPVEVWGSPDAANAAYADLKVERDRLREALKWIQAQVPDSDECENLTELAFVSRLQLISMKVDEALAPSPSGPSAARPCCPEAGSDTCCKAPPSSKDYCGCGGSADCKCLCHAVPVPGPSAAGCCERLRAKAVTVAEALCSEGCATVSHLAALPLPSQERGR